MIESEKSATSLRTFIEHSKQVFDCFDCFGARREAILTRLLAKLTVFFLAELALFFFDFFMWFVNFSMTILILIIVAKVASVGISVTTPRSLFSQNITFNLQPLLIASCNSLSAWIFASARFWISSLNASVLLEHLMQVHVARVALFVLEKERVFRGFWNVLQQQ